MLYEELDIYYNLEGCRKRISVPTRVVGIDEEFDVEELNNIDEILRYFGYRRRYEVRRKK